MRSNLRAVLLEMEKPLSDCLNLLGHLELQEKRKTWERRKPKRKMWVRASSSKFSQFYSLVFVDFKFHPNFKDISIKRASNISCQPAIREGEFGFFQFFVSSAIPLGSFFSGSTLHEKKLIKENTSPISEKTQNTCSLTWENAHLPQKQQSWTKFHIPFSSSHPTFILLGFSQLSGFIFGVSSVSIRHWLVHWLPKQTAFKKSSFVFCIEEMWAKSKHNYARKTLEKKHCLK